MRYIAIAGTHGADRLSDWDSPTSNFSKFLAKHDCTQLVTSPLKRYMWSTEVDGLLGKNDTWDAAGRALAHYVLPPLEGKPLVSPADTYIIAHSHGGNVIAYACGKYGLKVQGLVTVGMPIRKDMEPIYREAAKNIKFHLHIHAGWQDYWQVLGAVFDGTFGIHRKHPYAYNQKAPGGHGTVLRDPKVFHLWEDRGWLDYWTGKSPVSEKPNS